ncbi:CRTAC1 family protein, partial [Acidobacteria bacterium AH-259-O06]|nr:CRTAC1 family protein [Acidobacteria bacterium AH-259-O06]
DIVLTALASETFPLFFNSGNGIFIDHTYQAQIGLATIRMSGWGVGAYDFNNDGYKDLFFANSHVDENINLYFRHLHYKLPNAVFQNLRNGTFQDASARAGPTFQVARAHRGSAFGDLNNDGRVDVVVSAIGEEPAVLYNVSPGDYNWIMLDLAGTKSSRDAIGTRIKITSASGLVQYNHVSTAVSYASSSDRRVHFGLGEDCEIEKIELYWPSGRIQVLENVAVNQILQVKEK